MTQDSVRRTFNDLVKMLEPMSDSARDDLFCVLTDTDRLRLETIHVAVRRLLNLEADADRERVMNALIEWFGYQKHPSGGAV